MNPYVFEALTSSQDTRDPALLDYAYVRGLDGLNKEAGVLRNLGQLARQAAGSVMSRVPVIGKRFGKGIVIGRVPVTNTPIAGAAGKFVPAHNLKDVVSAGVDNVPTSYKELQALLKGKGIKHWVDDAGNIRIPRTYKAPPDADAMLAAVQGKFRLPKILPTATTKRNAIGGVALDASPTTKYWRGTQSVTPPEVEAAARAANGAPGAAGAAGVGRPKKYEIGGEHGWTQWPGVNKAVHTIATNIPKSIKKNPYPWLVGTGVGVGGVAHVTRGEPRKRGMSINFD